MKAKFNYNEASPLRFFVGDVRDKDRLKLALRGIDHVIHTAALKIVPTAEYNPIEFIKTNILGAQNVIECLTELDSLGSTKVIALSTDKAVSPINLYGATKLCAEKLFKAANNIKGPLSTKYSIVRYGNVANSTSSVIPVFLEQLKTGRLVLTHPEMTRFWITLEEAVDLTLRCLHLMFGGEVFVPDMPAFRIKQLGELFWTYGGIPLFERWFAVTGKRPGEKLHEVIIGAEEAENAIFSPADGLYLITPDTWIEKPMQLGELTSNSPNVKMLTKIELAEYLHQAGIIKWDTRHRGELLEISKEESPSTQEHLTWLQ